MKRMSKRLAIAILTLGLVFAGQAGTHLAKEMGFECYYNKLSVKQAHLSRFEKVLFTVLLATKDRLTKQKRQA